MDDGGIIALLGVSNSLVALTLGEILVTLLYNRLAAAMFP